MPFSCLPNKVFENLSDIAQRCLTATPVAQRAWTFNTSILRTDAGMQLVEEVKVWGRGSGQYIYHFQCTGTPDLALALHTFRSAKLRDKGLRSYAKPNEASPCLYVGGSKSIFARLKQHLGYSAAKGTYSLQLMHWATSLSLDITFSCARYSPEQAQDVLQALEDTLWDISGPMLGRRGAR